MTEKKSPRTALNEVLNIRIDDVFSREVARIAKVEGKSASEVARQLLEYGVEVQRQIEASFLQLSYKLDIATTSGRVVIDAAWKPYTQLELWEAERDRNDFIAAAEEFDRR